MKEASFCVAKKRIFPLATIGVVMLAGLGLLLFAQTRQPRYQPVADGVALGPSVQHSRVASDVLVQIAAGALTTAAGNSDAVVPQVGPTAPTQSEQALLDLTNADRAQNGLVAVAFDPASLQVARVRAAAQIPDGPLSHYNNLGQLAFVGLLADAGVSFSLAGENLARATAEDAATIGRLNDALMNSPTHRANILEPSFDLLAVGAATGPDGRLAMAEIFRSDSQ
jgi:uncharacterized protein YkwD